MNDSAVGSRSAVGQMKTFLLPLVAIVCTLTKLQKGHQYLSSNFIIEISPPGGKNQEGLAFVGSTVISRSSKVRKVERFSLWKRSKPPLLFL